MSKASSIMTASLLALLFMLPIGADAAESAPKACIGAKCFDVEVAVTPAELQRGLMFRKSMPESSGMIFIFIKELKVPFWMKNTLIPLDIIWIDDDNKIVYIKEEAQPCKTDPCPVIDPGEKARYVLEINGGLSKKFGFRPGDRVSLNLK